MDEKDKREIEEIFKHHIGILSEDFQHKLDVVVEGHQLLNEKIDRLQEGQEELTQRVDRVELITLRLEKRIDAVATDLVAHRADTEVHRTAYRVREGSD